jgi:outer membrane protein OmpA-like peptidoglycan-associated protein
VAIGCASAPSDPVATTSPRAPDRPATPPRKVVTETKVEVLDPIRFVGQSAAIDPVSIPILDAIAATLAGNPTIELVEVRAYGADAIEQFQAKVGVARAQAIVDQLVARGVAPSRLIAAGQARPPAGAPTVPVFEILQRSP